MREKPRRFAFTEAKIKALPCPESGRTWYYDTKASGLGVCKTAAGGCSFYFYKWIAGKPSRTVLGKWPAISVRQAQDAAREAMGKIAKGEDPGEDRRKKRREPTLADLWGHWLIHAEAHKKPVSVYEDKLKHNKYLKPWEPRRLGSIEKSDVQALHARVGRENGIYAANRLLSLLRAMFNKADEIDFHGGNPARGIKLFKERSRDRFLQPHELQAFFVALEAELPIVRDFYLLLLFTGARRSNVQSMRWVDLDLGRGLWRIPETKGGMPVMVPLVLPAVAILEKRSGQSGGEPWVFPGQHGKHLANPKGAWKRILESAKLDDLRPHDIRRTLGSWMAGENVSLPIIGRALGHTTPQATMVYSRLALDPIRAAVTKATTAMLTAGGQVDLLKSEQVEDENDG